MWTLNVIYVKHRPIFYQLKYLNCKGMSLGRRRKDDELYVRTWKEKGATYFKVKSPYSS
jgi:hypothetical protein